MNVFELKIETEGLESANFPIILHCFIFACDSHWNETNEKCDREVGVVQLSFRNMWNTILKESQFPVSRVFVLSRLLYSVSHGATLLTKRIGIHCHVRYTSWDLTHARSDVHWKTWKTWFSNLWFSLRWKISFYLNIVHVTWDLTHARWGWATKVNYVSLLDFFSSILL